MSLSEHFTRELSKMHEATGGGGPCPTSITVPVENDHSLNCCPLHMLNRNGLYVEPVPGKGLILHCDYTVSESLEAHIILWTLGQWDALLPALWRTGPEIPRRVQVKSRNRYRLPRGGQNENHH